MTTTPAMAETEIIAPNFKRRLSGVTSTIIQLVPAMRARGIAIAALGPGLPANMARIGFWQLAGGWRRPKNRRFRIWHARRNTEMIGGIVLRDILRMPLRLVFTSAAQRHHKPFTRFLINRMDGVIATSARSGSYLEVPHRVVMHGIALDRFQPPQDRAAQAEALGFSGRRLIGCFGRVRHQKGTDLFVDAMIELLPGAPDWTAVITGRVTAENRAFEADLRQRINAAGLQDRILFLGEVDDIRPWYRAVSLYVAPSRNEGFGLTPLEAMASGAPVVASDAGAYAEMIVPGATGAVVAAGDGPALTAAIARYLADPAIAEVHGTAALDHVRANFGLDREIDGISAVYDDLRQRT